jgi:hypothetical protein
MRRIIDKINATSSLVKLDHAAVDIAVRHFGERAIKRFPQLIELCKYAYLSYSERDAREMYVFSESSCQMIEKAKVNVALKDVPLLFSKPLFISSSIESAVLFDDVSSFLVFPYSGGRRIGVVVSDTQDQLRPFTVKFEKPQGTTDFYTNRILNLESLSQSERHIVAWLYKASVILTANHSPLLERILREGDWKKIHIRHNATTLPYNQFSSARIEMAVDVNGLQLWEFVKSRQAISG